jgi:hypothetical protein
MQTNVLCNLYFGNNNSGAGFMLRLDGRGFNNYSGIAPTTSWTAWAGPADVSAALKNNVWYTFVISISNDGSIKWASQQVSGTGMTGSFDENRIYTYSTTAVSDTSVYIAVNGDGGGATSYFSDIKIYDKALL